MAPVKRPNRIGLEGVTKRWSLREDENVTAAGLAQARADGTNLSTVVRERMRDYLKGHGWDVELLINGDVETIDAHWVELLGRPAPRGESRAIDPGGTMLLF